MAGLARSTPRGATELNPEDLVRLRPHVINLTQGRFSSDHYTTTSSDVDAIFDVHLPNFLKGKNSPVPVMIWAHGGLIDETSGLLIAQGQIDWWLRNGVYPLHFVWETGILDALKQIASAVLGRRGFDFGDSILDPAVEHAMRGVGSRVWQAMKLNAELSNGEGGGATYVAKRLADFAAKNPDRVSLHAVGHSAGSIFHSHFVPTALKAGVRGFDTVTFLAPAITVALFTRQLRSLVGADKPINQMTVFTMNREHERNDNCIGVYRKSLLYLVSRAFEAEREMPILGLEDSLRGDTDIAELFGLVGNGSGSASVVWSTTEDDAPLGSKSSSKTHGGFDNDSLTMESVAHRILRASGHDSPDVEPFPDALAQTGRQVWRQYDSRPAEASSVSTPSACPPVATQASAPSRSGSRNALCVGIDSYPTDPLSGAVSDAVGWANALEQLGFSVTTLLDRAATRAGLIEQLSALLGSAQPGDVVVFQYAGHGTFVPDAELGGEDPDENDAHDEALCPHDYDTAGLLLDDDIHRIISTHLKPGVNLTGFLDCCHSGSAFRGGGPRPSPDATLKRRYLPFDSSMLSHANLQRSAPPPRAVTHHVMFSACRDDEVAYESDGAGHFTTKALSVLIAPQRTNRQFADEVDNLFGTRARQHPDLQTFETDAKNRGFLAPIPGI